MKAFLKKEGAFIIILFLLALGLRLVYLAHIQRIPLFDAPIMDAKYHDEWAQAIARDWPKAILTGTSLHEAAPYFRAPLYPYFLALISTVSHHSYLWPRIVQFILGSGSVLLIYFLGRRMFDPLVGHIAGVLAAVYGPFIFFEGELLLESVTPLLNLLAILAVLRAQGRPRWWGWLGCGALLGLSAVARPTVLAFLLALIPWMLLRLRRQGLGWWRSVGHVLAVLLGVGLLTLPVHIHNYRMSKEFLPSMVSQGGVNFFIGNNPDSDGATAIVPGTRATWWGGYYDAVQLAQDAEGRTLRASEVSDYWFRRGLEFIRDEPAAALRLMLRKVAFFWGGTEIANNQDTYFFAQMSPLLRLLIRKGLIWIPFGIVAPLALAGMVLAWLNRQGRGRGLAMLFVFAYMAGVVVFFVCDRYRLPIIPFLLPFAAYSLAVLLRRPQRSALLTAVVLILTLGVLANANLAGTPVAAVPAESFTTLGNVYVAKEQYAEAKEEYRRALAMTPDYVRALAGLARVYDQTDSTAKAIELWERAIAQDAEQMDLHFSLGFSYYAAGRLDEAIAQWEETARLRPEFAQAHFQLGIAQEDKGDIEKAIFEYKKTVQLNPQYILANYNLGHLYLKLGRTEEAIAEFQAAVAANPKIGDPYNSLAWVYAQQGINLDQGVELVNKALELDAESRAYWDTLAELYIKKGEPDKAREIFQRMIQREPNEPFWRERLKEVGG